MTRGAIIVLLSLATPAAAQLFPSFERNTVPPDAAPSSEPSRALPNPKLTPGAADGRVTLHTICTGLTKQRRRVPPGRCDAVFRAYGVPDTPIARYSYECDHLVPLAIGGSNAAENLWPQPNLEAALKDRCETAAKERVCSGVMTLDHAQALFIQHDWPTACRAIAP